MKHFLPFLLYLAVLFCNHAEAAPRRRRGTHFGIKEKLTSGEKQQILSEIMDRGSKAPTEFNTSVRIDHYNNEPVKAVSNTFSLRYLVND